MKLQSLITFGIGIIALAGTQAALAQGGKTRDEVRAELAQAIRSGDVLAAGESGLPLNQLRPDLYPHVAQAPGKSRDQVKAELAEALRTGDIIAEGDITANRNEVNPALYPAVAKAPGKSREEARSELAQALRDGTIVGGGEAALALNQQFPYSYGEAHHMLAFRGFQHRVN